VLRILRPLGNPGPDPPGGDPALPVSGGGDDRDEGFKLAFLRNSPVGHSGAFLVELAEDTRARLDVFDLQGRRLRSLADRTMPAGATVVAWDDRAASGARLGPGGYFVRMRAGQQVRTTRVFVAP
jgi:hypothetical protein